MNAQEKRARAESDGRVYAAAAALILSVLAFTYYAFGHPSPGKHFDIDAIVSSSNQLRHGSPVRIAGIDVGVIRDIQRGPGHTTKITMRIDAKGQPLHTDASLKIRPRLFLEGGYYVDLRAGSPSAPKLHSGATLPLSQTAIPVQLNDILSELDSPARASFTRIIGEIHTAVSGGGARSFRRTMPQLGPALRDLAWVAAAARGTKPHDVSTLVSQGAKLVKALDTGDNTLASLVGNLDRSAQALNSGDGALGRTIEGIDRVVRAAPPVLTGLDASLPTLVHFARVLRPALPAAPAQLRQINDGLHELAALVTPAERKKVVKALTVTFEDLPTLVNRLGGLFPTTHPVTDCLGSHVVPTFKQSVPDGSLSTGQPVWQELAHALVGFSGISQNFDGNGFQTRYAAAFSGSSLSLGNLPGIGAIVSAAPPLQARPVWLGNGSTPAFRPDVPCASQPLADPASGTSAPAMRRIARTAPPTVTRARLARALAPSHVGKLIRELSAR